MNKIFTFNKVNLFFVFLLFIYIEPPFLSLVNSFEGISKLFPIMRCLIGIGFVFLFIKNKQFIKGKKYLIIFCLFQIALNISSILNESFYITYLINSLNLVFFFIINLYFLRDKTSFFKSYVIFLFSYVLIHFLTMILFPNGFTNEINSDNRIWFLGRKNGLLLYIFPLLISLYMLCELLNKKRYMYLSYFIIIPLLFYNNSSTTFLISLLFIFSSLFFDKFRRLNFNFSFIFIFILVFFLLILLNQTDLKIFEIITSMVGKNLTFTGRTNIWNLAFSDFLNHPIIGNGINLTFIPWTNMTIVYTAHNTFLDIMAKYGLLSLIPFLIMNVYLLYIYLKSKRNYLTQLGLCCLFIFLLACQFEAYFNYFNTVIIYIFIYILINNDGLQNKSFNFKYEILKLYERISDHLNKKIIDKCLTKYYMNKRIDYGLNKTTERDKKIIISLTSYPPRYEALYCTLKSLMSQSVKPDKIILYLYKGDYNQLSSKILDLKKYGLTINVVDEDLRSHKKYYYSFQEYKNELIITVDDDLIYSKNLVKKLYNAYKQHPSAIIAMRTHRILFNEKKEILPYQEWDYECRTIINSPSYFLIATTGAGTLFCPELFSDEVLKKNIFLNYAKTADDIWIKFVSLLDEIPIICIGRFYVLHSVIKSQNISLASVNVENNENNVIINQLLKYYKISLFDFIEEKEKKLEVKL